MLGFKNPMFKIKFKDLSEGQIFYYNDHYYIKILEVIPKVYKDMDNDNLYSNCYNLNYRKYLSYLDDETEVLYCPNEQTLTVIPTIND